MPIMKCTTSNGESGFKYGESGHCYKSKQDALKQMRAIKSNSTFIEELKIDKEITAEDIAQIDGLDLTTKAQLILSKTD